MSCVDPLEARLAEVVKRGLPETSQRTLSLSARDEILAEALRADVVALGPGSRDIPRPWSWRASWWSAWRRRSCWTRTA